jgi:hypothetical protein
VVIMGIIDKLKLAATNKVVEELLVEGNSFSMASQKTRRKWRTVATKRVKEIQATPDQPSLNETSEEKTQKKKRKQKT